MLFVCMCVWGQVSKHGWTARQYKSLQKIQNRFIYTSDHFIFLLTCFFLKMQWQYFNLIVTPSVQRGIPVCTQYQERRLCFHPAAVARSPWLQYANEGGVKRLTAWILYIDPAQVCCPDLKQVGGVRTFTSVHICSLKSLVLGCSRFFM